MKRRAHVAAVAFYASSLGLALACGDLKIGEYPGRAGAAGGGASSQLPAAAGAAGASIAAGGSSAAGGSVAAGGASGALGGALESTGGAGSAGAMSGGAGSSSGGDAGQGSAAGDTAVGGAAGTGSVEKPQYLKEWEPHLGAPAPRVTSLGYALPRDGAPVAPLYIGYDNGDVFLKVTSTSTWQRADLYTGPHSPPEDYSLPRLPVAMLRQSPYDAQSTWVAFTGGVGRKLWHTGNGSQYWLQAFDGPLIDILSISVDPFSRSAHLIAVGFVGGDAYVYDSLNYGSNWSAGSSGHPGAPPAQWLVSAMAATANEEQIWAGSARGELFIATGAPEQRVWTEIDSPEIPKRTVTSITLDPHDPLRAYVSFVGPLREGLWLTTDGGQSFSPSAAQALPESASARDAVYGVSVHPLFEDVLYVATSQGGFWSADRGASWHP